MLRQEFQGFARIAIESLSFQKALEDGGHRSLAQRNVIRLCKNFKLEGCLRYEETNFVSGLVTPAQLGKFRDGSLLRPEDIGSRSLEDLRIVRDIHVECLHGLHRIRAAEDVLDENDQWWIVKVFTEELPKSAIVHQTQQYLNEKEFTDGEIFRNIRNYARLGEEKMESKWWTRLTESKRKDLKQLLRNSKLTQAFDGLLPWSGLWYPVQLGTLHRLLALKCEEEMHRYLLHINSVWKKILLGTSMESNQNGVDKETVEIVQALAPGVSTTDRRTINDAMDNGLLFCRIEDREQRRLIKENLRKIDCLIPSLFTFFESLKYLEPCCQIVKRLLKPQFKKSIREELFGTYWRPSITEIEYNDGKFQKQSQSTLEKDRDLAYWQLWLFAMRNFPQLTSLTPRKEMKKKKPVVKEPNPAVWHSFGTLAMRLGFETKAAKEFCNQDPDVDLARALVDQHTGDANSYTTQVRQIAGITKSLRDRNTLQISSAFLTSSVEVPLERRLGRPFQNAFEHDRPLLFLPCIQSAKISDSVSNITTFFAARDMFIHFFGIGQVSTYISANLNALLTIQQSFVELESDTVSDSDRNDSDHQMYSPHSIHSNCNEALDQHDHNSEPEDASAEVARGYLNDPTQRLDDQGRNVSHQLQEQLFHAVNEIDILKTEMRIAEQERGRLEAERTSEMEELRKLNQQASGSKISLKEQLDLANSEISRLQRRVRIEKEERDRAEQTFAMTVPSGPPSSLSSTHNQGAESTLLTMQIPWTDKLSKSAVECMEAVKSHIHALLPYTLVAVSADKTKFEVRFTVFDDVEEVASRVRDRVIEAAEPASSMDQLVLWTTELRCITYIEIPEYLGRTWRGAEGRVLYMGRHSALVMMIHELRGHRGNKRKTEYDFTSPDNHRMLDRPVKQVRGRGKPGGSYSSVAESEEL